LPVHGAPGECYYNTLLCCDYFSSNLVSFVPSIAELAPWR